MSVPNDFQPGDMVFFHGILSVVLDDDWGAREKWPYWAVPIMVGGSQFVTIAHSDALNPAEGAFSELLS